jgi:cysteine desulfurase
MLKFTRRTDYAVQALLHMASRQGDGPVSAREIAECHDIPVELTAKLLQALARAELCESRQGPRGGYRLGKPAAAISLRAVIEAVEGGEESEHGSGACGYSQPLAAVQAELTERFERISLGDLARRDGAHFAPRIYLDHQATTPLDPRVRAAMEPFLSDRFGNAASVQHAYGWEAEAAVKAARVQVAGLIGAEPREIIWTSGATEACNLAIKGVAEAYADKGRQIVTCATEHPAVLDCCHALEKRGWRITLLPVDGEGRIDLAELAAALGEETVLVSLMAANNEIGLLHPLEEIAALTRERGVLLHVDAAQAAGKIPIDVKAMGIDLLSLSAHKLYGPKGVGALYASRKGPRVSLKAQIHGGGHEEGRRSGTANVPGIVGLGEAARICAEEMATEQSRLLALRERLHEGLQADLEGVRLNGAASPRLAGNLNLSFEGVDSDGLLMKLRTLALSSASACSSASLAPSYVLRAMGLTDDRIHGALRLSPGRFTTEDEIDRAVTAIVAAVHELRAANPLAAENRIKN